LLQTLLDNYTTDTLRCHAHYPGVNCKQANKRSVLLITETYRKLPYRLTSFLLSFYLLLILLGFYHLHFNIIIIFSRPY